MNEQHSIPVVQETKKSCDEHDEEGLKLFLVNYKECVSHASG